MTGILLPRALPNDKGLHPQAILGLLGDVQRLEMELHGLMIYRAGAVVTEAYWRPYGSTRAHVQHSITKSWAAAGVGLLIDDGLLNLDDRVVSFFPNLCPAEVSQNLATMTIRDLLTMRTGHREGISGGAWRGQDISWVKAFLEHPVPDPPGQYFIYSSASSYMLSAISTVVTGETLHATCQRRLFGPMGMTDVRWDVSPEGFNAGGNGLTCTLEDSLKFGVLHLNKGRWHGRQLLSEHWVNEATCNQVAEAWLGRFDGKRYLSREESGETGIKRQEGYGYQWWLAPYGGYRASGMFGQECLVFPHHDLVVAVTSGLPRGEGRIVSLISKWLLPAIGEVSRSCDMSQQALSRYVAELSLPDLLGSANHANPHELTGTWEMAENMDKITQIKISFSADGAKFVMIDDRGRHSVKIGLGEAVECYTSMTGHYLHHAYQPELTPVVAHGAWTFPNTFEMQWCFVETAFTDRIICRLVEGKLWVDRSVNVNAGPTFRPTLYGTKSST